MLTGIAERSSQFKPANAAIVVCGLVASVTITYPTDGATSQPRTHGTNRRFG